MAMKIRLDRAGMAAMLNSAEVGSAVDGLGAAVKGGVSETAGGQAVPVRTRRRVAQGGRLSARPAVDVELAHPAGLRIEAKRGSLVRAAAAAGLEVTARRSVR